MKLFKYLTACSVFAAVVAPALPANSITLFTNRTNFENSLLFCVFSRFYQYATLSVATKRVALPDN